MNPLNIQFHSNTEQDEPFEYPEFELLSKTEQRENSLNNQSFNSLVKLNRVNRFHIQSNNSFVKLNRGNPFTIQSINSLVRLNIVNNLYTRQF